MNKKYRESLKTPDEIKAEVGIFMAEHDKQVTKVDLILFERVKFIKPVSLAYEPQKHHPKRV